jgi:hypothetical protein
MLYANVSKKITCNRDEISSGAPPEYIRNAGAANNIKSGNFVKKNHQKYLISKLLSRQGTRPSKPYNRMVTLCTYSFNIH